MPIPYFSRWASVNFSSFTNTIKSLTIKLKIFTDSAFSFWGTMPEKKQNSQYFYKQSIQGQR